ncbi:putative DNA helicase [Pedobacter psychrotolerans]|uniref:Helicase n=1 Tax=Pedobacter psychrotolerans TaxID=1843235 RepID=A0A4R2HBB2_9SPHI|nr:AAA domain-containing protein [Pedobacter psychrotolerans]TCO22457.1 putative DNA helicase [Pedobacter psychrotolerans]GGE64712.1 helicase [Pedobacter psychrotolerans]
MSKEYFKNLQDLLHIEREEDLQSYLKLTQNTSAADRRALGLTWYPIAIRNTEMGKGDYLTVELERTTHQDLSHQFRFGSSVVLFSNHDPKTDQVEGIISHQSANKVKVSLRIDELPDWARDGKLGLDLLFDNNSYDEMQQALKQATNLTEDAAENKLIKVIASGEKPSFQHTEKFILPNGLNESQQLAVSKIVSADHLAIIHGPPGTGKTTTIVQAIKSLIKHRDQKILVVAPSNTAVDLLTEKLAIEGLNVIRIGNPARVSEKLLSATLDHQMADHQEMKTIKTLKKQASEYKNMAHKYKRSFGKAERDQRKALFDEAHKIGKEIEKTESYIMDHLFNKAQVITATLVGANHYTVRQLKYHTVVIDEAGQALEPACWIPILKAQKLILAGDHFQLPPTIKSTEAAKKGLSNTLLEKLVNLHPESVVLLNEQYRMNKNIMGYSSKVFYEDKLIAHASVAEQLLFKDDEPLNFIDTAGCSFDEKLDGTSTTNPEEAAFLIRHLHQLVTRLQMDFSLEYFPTIAIISPYKQQVQILKALMLEDDLLLKHQNKIAVNTIDSFQGQERDVVYISLTRSNSEGNIGFLSDTRRMNVAMTRARKKLVVIGDSSTLSKAKFYADFIGYAEKLNTYHSAWEYIDT